MGQVVFYICDRCNTQYWDFKEMYNLLLKVRPYGIVIGSISNEDHTEMWCRKCVNEVCNSRSPKDQANKALPSPILEKLTRMFYRNEKADASAKQDVKL